ncbi:MAG: hypothetical protein IKP88_17395 [Lachnospiraceae bacterium]|nr:hypothetical protein [Lachnospiraceae bacterium]
MKKMIRKMACLMLALILVMSLTACSADPNCGKYICKTVSVGEITVDASNAYVNGASLELKKAGACDVVLDGTTYLGSWKSTDSTLTISLQETDSVGTIAGNKITIDLFGVGMTMTFEK